MYIWTYISMFIYLYISMYMFDILLHVYERSIISKHWRRRFSPLKSSWEVEYSLNWLFWAHLKVSPRYFNDAFMCGCNTETCKSSCAEFCIATYCWKHWYFLPQSEWGYLRYCAQTWDSHYTYRNCAQMGVLHYWREAGELLRITCFRVFVSQILTHLQLVWKNYITDTQ